MSNRHLPTYEWRDAEHAIQRINNRTKKVRTVSVEYEGTIKKTEDRPIRIKAVLVVSLPNLLRLRAWKLGNAVFDLTITEDGVWWWSANADVEQDQWILREESFSGVEDVGRLIGCTQFDLNYTDVRDIGAGLVEFRRLSDSSSDSLEVAVVDRRTLTVREFQFRSSGKLVPRRLILSNYRVFEDGVVFPTFVKAIGPEGWIAFRVHAVHLNEPLAHTAFQPPRRAARIYTFSRSGPDVNAHDD